MIPKAKWHVIFIESLKLEIDSFVEKIEAVRAIKKLLTREYVVKDSITLVEGDIHHFQVEKTVSVDLTFYNNEENE